MATLRASPSSSVDGRRRARSSRHPCAAWRLECRCAATGPGPVLRSLDAGHRRALRPPGHLRRGDQLLQGRPGQRRGPAGGLLRASRLPGAMAGKRTRPGPLHARHRPCGRLVRDGVEPGRRHLRLREQPLPGGRRVRGEDQSSRWRRRLLHDALLHQRRQARQAVRAVDGSPRPSARHLGKRAQPLCQSPGHRDPLHRLASHPDASRRRRRQRRRTGLRHADLHARSAADRWTAQRVDRALARHAGGAVMVGLHRCAELLGAPCGPARRPVPRDRIGHHRCAHVQRHRARRDRCERRVPLRDRRGHRLGRQRTVQRSARVPDARAAAAVEARWRRAHARQPSDGPCEERSRCATFARC